ncbi:hypothetical protein GH714_009885 [Hevea brasiliensis]|uniref:Uncharacterized protein n=1 Tax=Hevea brasiliensis TaxID=3981 RepID=A0A6A6M6J2_HEVBR|nr:hypothetical protein GH714_009847 [Hevea brasiliensis]KAF2308477.1 hypothetical protein GH714_009885 [Hevea brasiliensis]
MEETGDLVDQGEICNSIILEEEDSAKKSEAQKDDVEDSPKNSSLKKDDAVEKEDAKLATEPRNKSLRPVHKEVEKADFDETVKHLNKEENDIQEIHTVSTEDEREDEVSLTI